MSYWLFKEEPTHYSFDDLVADKRTRWEGVRNNLAQKNLRAMRKGDRGLYYHTGDVKAVVGLVEVISDPYPDPAADDPRFVIIEIKPAGPLARPVTLAEIKADRRLADFDLVRLPRLSVVSVSRVHWQAILSLAKRKP